MPPEPPPAQATPARLRWQTLLVFAVSATLYFLGRTPALDEWDSVQFAQGVGDFNLWRHHPHPPGYPLYELAGWLGHHGLGLDVPTALGLVSALGGGLFVAAWFALAAQSFGRFAGVWCAVATGTLLTTVMSATKVLTDPPSAGLLAWTLLLVGNRRLALAAAAGALAVGVRPQTFPVLLLIVGLSAVGGPLRRWLTVLGAFLGTCLLWLVPTMFFQALTPESGGRFLAYPAQLLAQWRWRLDQPKAFVGADAHGQSFLLYRLDHHVLGLFTRGCGFALNASWGWLGIGVLVVGWTFYGWPRRPEPPGPVAPHRAFWKLHAPWAALYVAVVFCCLPGDQRYYLPVFPLLLLPALLGWARVSSSPRGRWLALAVPAATLLATLPYVAENHREAAPPVRMLRFLQAQYPPAERADVHLLLRDSFRHAQWYAPEFPLENAADPGADAPLEPHAILYTDDPTLAAAAPDRWRRVATFERPVLIYRKHHEVTLYRLNSPPARQG